MTEVATKHSKKDQKSKPVAAIPFPADKEGRIIIRNLPFDVKEPHLLKAFTKFGVVIDVKVPLKNENNMNKGFGFVEFSTKDDA